MIRKFISSILMLSMLCAFAICVNASEIVDSGECGAQGDNLTWVLDSEGTLTISGEGEMTDYEPRESPWYNNSNVKSIYIDNGVTSIGKLAFYWCRQNEGMSIKIPSSIVKINEDAFYYSNIKKVYIDDLNSWCNIQFSNAYSSPFIYTADLYINNALATYIKIPNNITDINQYMFAHCTSIKSIDVHAGVKTIADISTGVLDCSNLEEINIDFNNKNYSSEDGMLFNKEKTALLYCPTGKQGTYLIPDTVLTIEKHAFNNCRQLTKVDIPYGVTHIEDYAFRSSGLTSVEIPDSVTELGKGAFVFCVNLNNVTLSRNITQIKPSTFSDCYKLNDVNIKNGLTFIGTYAFNCCAFRFIQIPTSVVEIEDDAFYNCNKLQDVYYLDSREQWNEIKIGTDTHGYFVNADFHFNATGITPPKIADLTFVDGDYIKVLLTDTKYDSTMLAVFYKDGAMIDMQTTPVKAGDEMKDIPIPDNSGADSAKVFIWSSLDSMKPLCEAKEIDITL